MFQIQRTSKAHPDPMHFLDQRSKPYTIAATPCETSHDNKNRLLVGLR